MHSTTEESHNVGLDVVWWSDHDGFFTHYHMISAFSFEAWAEPASVNEQWIPSTSGELSQTKSMVLETSDPMEYDDAEISSDEAYEGARSLRLACASTSTTPEQMLYTFSADTKRNKRALGADVGVSLAVFPSKVSSNAHGVIEILLSLHEPVSSARWEQYSLRYFLHPDPELPRFLDGAVYNIPVAYTENQWNLLDLNLTQDAIEGFEWLRGIDNSLFQLNLGVEASLGDTAEVFFDDLQISTTLADEEVLEVQQVMMDSLEARRPNVYQLQSVETNFKHMNILGEGFDLPDYDSIAQAGGFMDANGWIANQAAFEDYCSRAIVDQAHARGSVVSYNHMFGANTNSTGGPDPLATANTLEAAEMYGADLLEVGYVARGGQDLDAHVWVWDELARRGLYKIGVGVTDAHGLSPGDWGTRVNRLISWIYADEPTSASLLGGLKRGRVYFGDLLIFGGTIDLSTANGFMMGQLVFTDKDAVTLTFSAEGLTPGDVVRTYWDGELANTYVASQATFTQDETRQLGTENTFVRFSVTTPSGGNKAFSNPMYFLRQIPEDGLTSPRAGFEVGDVHSTMISDFTITNLSHVVVEERLTFTIDGSGTNGVIVVNMANSVIPDSVRFDGISGSWEFLDTLLVLSALNGTGSIEVSGGSGVLSPPALLSPANGSQNNPPDVTLTWAPTYSPDPVTYRLQVSSDSAFASLVDHDSTQVDTTFQVDSLDNGTTYYWKVRAENEDTQSLWSPVWSFRTIVLPPDTADLVIPADSAVVTTHNSSFIWRMAGPEVDRYRFELDTTSAFLTAFVDSLVTDTTTSVVALVNGTRYWWRAKAHNAAGWGEYSVTRTFTTDLPVPPPPAPVPLLPADDATGVTPPVTFVWGGIVQERVLAEKRPNRTEPARIAGPRSRRAVDGNQNPLLDGDSTRYHFQLSADSTLITMLVEDSTLVDTTFQVDSLASSTRHYWRVSALSDAGKSSWSDVWSFVTDGPPDPGIPCGAIFQFQARCKTDGTVLMRITLRNSTQYAGQVVTFQVDSTIVNTTAITNGTHTMAKTQLRNQSSGPHVVSLIVPGGCFDPTTVTCPAGEAGDEGEWWDDDYAWSELNGGFLLEEIPARTELLDNYPNPFNPATTLRYALSTESRVEIRIHNILGQVVRTLVDDFVPAGQHSVVWNGTSDFGREVTSGIYFVTMHARNGEQNMIQSKKILLLR